MGSDKAQTPCPVGRSFSALQSQETDEKHGTGRPGQRANPGAALDRLLEALMEPVGCKGATASS
jgi:hypothetical protein